MNKSLRTAGILLVSIFVISASLLIVSPKASQAQILPFGNRSGGLLNPLNILDPLNLLSGGNRNNNNNCYSCNNHGGYDNGYNHGGYNNYSYNVPLYQGATYNLPNNHGGYPRPYPTPSPYPYPTVVPQPYPVYVPQPQPVYYPQPQPYPVYVPQQQPIYVEQPQPVYIQQPQPVIIQQQQPVVIASQPYPVYQQYQQYPNPLNLSCSPNIDSSSKNKPVTWTAFVTGAMDPYTFSWSGTESYSNPNSNSLYLFYSTYGQKFMSVTVRSADGQQASVSCGSVNITNW